MRHISAASLRIIVAKRGGVCPFVERKNAFPRQKGKMYKNKLLFLCFLKVDKQCSRAV